MSKPSGYYLTGGFYFAADGSGPYVLDTAGNMVLANQQTPLTKTAATWTYAAAAGGIVNTTTAVTIKAAPTAPLRNYLTSLQISYDTLTSGTELVIRDGAGGTVLWRLNINTSSAPRSVDFYFAVPLSGSPGNLLEVATVTATGSGGIYVNAQGFVGA